MPEQPGSSSSSNALPFRYNSPEEPICVFDGAVWGRRQIDMNVFDFSGRHYFRIERNETMLTSTDAIWHETAVLSWLSCEQNVNHLIGETLNPIWSTIYLTNASHGKAHTR